MEAKNALLNQDWFDLNFIGNFLNKDNKQVRFINEKRFPLKPEIISSRVMTNWIEQGVVDDPRDNKTGKHWFSVSELVWINLLIKLRGFNQKLEKFKQIKKELEVFNEYQSYSKNPLLDFYILFALVCEKTDPLYFILFESSQSLFAKQEDIQLAQNHNLIGEDYIRIDFTSLVFGILERKNRELDCLIKEDSIQEIINDLVNSTSFKSIRIDNNQKDYLISKELFFEDKKKVDDLFYSFPYADLSIKKNGGKSMYYLTQKFKVSKEFPNSN